MPQIFISYRRADSHAITDRIQDRLEAVYGTDNVFQDVEDIPPGANFKEYLEIQVGLCDVLLVIIGPRWLDIRDDNGNRRLDNPSDFVRIEVESGLRRKDILVVPVLVQGASMPLAADLPPTMRELHYRNAIRVRNNPDFDRDIQNLIESINQYVKETSPKKPESSRARSPLMWVGGLVALLVVAAALILVGLPALQGAAAPSATPTADTTGTAQAVAAAGTATASAGAPTSTPTELPGTPTSTPTPSPSPEPSATPTATATVRYVDGRELVLDYNDTGFYLRNASSDRVAVNSLRFRSLNEAGAAQSYQFTGGVWAQNVPQLATGRCARLELLNRSTFTRPAECATFAVTHRPAADNSTVFWIPRANVSGFAVYWNNEEVGRCVIADGHCAVRIPPA
jgi:hypothetical protein